MEMLVLMYSKQKIISIIFYPFFLVYKWIIDIGKTLHAHDGWKLLVNLIAGIFIFLGIWQTWLTYTASHHTALTQKLEKKYYDIKNSLHDDNKWLRISAIQNIYILMTTTVPESKNPTSYEAFQYLFGKKVKGKILFYKEAQKMLFMHLRYMSKNKKLSSEEMSAIVSLLEKLGEKGWNGEGKGEKKKSISWMWKESKHTIYPYSNAYTLFSNIKVNGANFNNFNLTRSFFKDSNLSHASMKNTTLNFSNLSHLDLSHSIISYSKLLHVNGMSINLNNADLYGCTINNTNFSNCTAIDSNMMQLNAKNVKFINSNLTKTKFSNSIVKNSFFNSSIMKKVFANKANFSHSDFSFSNLEDAILNDTNLRHCNFKLAEMKNATLFKSDITGSDFTGSDLRMANLQDIIGLESVISWKGANIANIKGLTNQKIMYLKSKGAISIIDDKKWKLYKEKGISR